MKIAILGSRGIPARYGGFETFAEGIATRLVAEGHEVTVYCEWGMNTPESYCGVKLVHVKVPGWGSFSPVGYDAKCLFHARGKYDVVYMLGYSSSPLFLRLFVGKARLWVNMDGMEWKRSKYPLFAEVYLRMTEWLATCVADHLVFDAEAIAENYRNRYKKLPPYSVIAYGSDKANEYIQNTVLDEWGLQPKSFYLIICRLVPENHILEIIQGYNSSESKYPLVVVAHDNPKHAYFKSCKAIANDQVKFMGTLYDPAALGKLRAECLAYFHGHSVGGTNPSLIEAMLYGALVIAHDNPFNREVTENQGLYFSAPEDIPTLIEFLETERETTLQTQKKALQRRALDHYSWKKILSQYLQLLQPRD